MVRRSRPVPREFDVPPTSALDEVWRWDHSFEGAGVALADPTETILRELSVAYLDAGTARGVAAFEPLLGRRPELVPVGFHPYKGNWFAGMDPALDPYRQPDDPDGPFVGTGWLVEGFDGEMFDVAVDREGAAVLSPAGRELCVSLLDGSPSLMLCGGGRWARARRTRMDSADHLVCLLDSRGDAATWAPIGEVPDAVATTVWARARAAAERADAVATRELLAEASRTYSPAGHRVLRAGLLDLLAWRVELAQEADAEERSRRPG
jgi:hypothetical protein